MSASGEQCRPRHSVSLLSRSGSSTFLTYAKKIEKEVKIIYQLRARVQSQLAAYATSAAPPLARCPAAFSPVVPTQVCRALLDRGHSVVVVTGAPARMILRELPSPRLAIRKASLDFGAKQKDAFSVDMLGAPRSWATLAAPAT